MSALFSFDPDAQLARINDGPAAAPSPIRDQLPESLRDGIQRLHEMPVPRAASAARWAQIVADATHLAWWHFEEAATAGWTAGELFGLDTSDATPFVGLAIIIRGGRVVEITCERITIDQPGYRRFFHHSDRSDAPPLWLLRGIE